jgi:hypothetical protein
LSQTNPTKADPAAIAQALVQSAQQVHRIAIDPADEAEVLANLELAARMLQQLDRVELSDDHIDLAPTFLPTAPEQS